MGAAVVPFVGFGAAVLAGEGRRRLELRVRFVEILMRGESRIGNELGC